MRLQLGCALRQVSLLPRWVLVQQTQSLSLLDRCDGRRVRL
jgi:hypothetical protein